MPYEIAPNSPASGMGSTSSVNSASACAPDKASTLRKVPADGSR
jgi:hypothetical protein